MSRAQNRLNSLPLNWVLLGHRNRKRPKKLSLRHQRRRQQSPRKSQMRRASHSQIFSRTRTRRDTARHHCLNKPQNRPASPLAGSDFSLIVYRRKQVHHTVDRRSTVAKSVDHLLLIDLENIRHRHSWMKWSKLDFWASRSYDKPARYHTFRQSLSFL